MPDWQLAQINVGRLAAPLWRLDRFGPGRDAFTFKTRFPAPDKAGPPVDHRPDPWCVGRA